MRERVCSIFLADPATWRFFWVPYVEIVVGTVWVGSAEVEALFEIETSAVPVTDAVYGAMKSNAVAPFPLHTAPVAVVISVQLLTHAEPSSAVVDPRSLLM